MKTTVELIRSRIYEGQGGWSRSIPTCWSTPIVRTPPGIGKQMPWSR